MRIGVLALQVDFQGEPPAGRPQRIYSHVFEPGAPNKHEERLILRSDRDPSWDYAVTAVLADGRTVVHEVEGYESRQLLLSLAAILQG